MDIGHRETDKIIEKIEKEIAKEYAQAHKEVTSKLEDYLERFKLKDKKWQEWVANGTKTKAEYTRWRTGQMVVGKRWRDMKEVLATDLSNTYKIADSIARGYRPEVYALNHNFQTYLIEQDTKIDTSYTLYSRETVERLYRDNPKIYSSKIGKKVQQQINEGKLKRWERRRIQSVLTQGILQGESIPNLTKRLEQVTGGDHKSAIRNARTMMTGVQNAGRVDAMFRARGMGIPLDKQWLATADGRTRHWHRELDGVAIPLEEAFNNEYGDIMYPGDPGADGANIYNCRCTLVQLIKGFETDFSDLENRYSKLPEGQTYEEWKATRKATSNPITLPERKAEAYRQAWIRKYGGNGSGIKKTSASFHSDKLEKAMGKEYNGFKDKINNADNKQLYIDYTDKVKSIVKTSAGGQYSPSFNRLEFSYAKDEGLDPFGTIAHEFNHAFDRLIGKDSNLTFKEVELINQYCPIGTGVTKTFKEVPSSCDTFLSALREDAEALKSKVLDRSIRTEMLVDKTTRNVTSGVQDMLDGFFGTQDEGLLPWGHGNRYYNRAYNKRIKAFDNDKNLKKALTELGFDASNQAKVKKLCRIYETSSEAWANVGSAVTCKGKELDAIKKYMPKTYEAYLEIIQKIGKVK